MKQIGMEFFSKATAIFLIINIVCFTGKTSAGIRKCCPKGLIFDDSLNETVVCQEGPLENLNFPLHNEFGIAISSLEGPQIPDIIEVDYALMMCTLGKPVKRKPELGKCFSILPNGSIFVPRFPIGEQVSDEYCVDYELNEDGVQSLIGMICRKSPPPAVQTPEEIGWVFKIYPYLLLVSSAFLVATFIVYAIIPELRNIHGVSIMCHVASLAVTYIGIGLMQTITHFLNDEACIIIGVITHYAFLSAFTWLSVISFDIWWIFSDLRPTLEPGRVGRRHTGKRIVSYFIYAWTVPFIIVMTGVILDYNYKQPRKCWFQNEEERESYLLALSRSTEIIRPHFGEGSCWFQRNDPAIIAYLYGPIGILIIPNIFFFIMTVNALHKESFETALAAGKHKTKQQFRVIFCIFILMGLSWTLELVSYAVGGNPSYWILTDVINILINGVVIFVLFVCKATVWRHLTSKFPFLKKLIAIFG